MEIKQSYNHLSYLDSLRGIAALIVVIEHTHKAFYINEKSFVSSIFQKIMHFSIFNGEFAVTLFFILSGFVLSFNFFKNYKTQYLIKQSIKRIPRLVTPVILTSIVYWIFIHFDWLLNKEVVEINQSEYFAGYWQEKYSILKFFISATYDLFVLNDQKFCWNINRTSQHFADGEVEFLARGGFRNITGDAQ